MTPGSLVDGKYRVDRKLGEGGMATVFAATHIHLNEQVAIKVLLPRFTTEPTVVERFLREARAAVRLKSEHVVRVIDVGTLPTNQPYIAMEFLDGRDLEDLLAQRGGPFPAPEMVDYVLQLCEALAEAHAQGIVHRDIKPANCVLTQSRDGMPLIKVLDFGIAKLSLGNNEGPRLTGTSTMMGTPAFMSPEQLRGAKDVDLRGDIWSVGIMMFELAMGKVPFAAPTFAKLLMAVQRDPTPPMPTLPPGLAAVIQRCLLKDREQRYQNIAELARELEPFAGNRPHAALLVQRCTGVSRRLATPPSGVPQSPGTPPAGVPQSLATPPRGVPHSSATPPSGVPRSPSGGVPHSSATPPSGVPRSPTTPSAGVPYMQTGPGLQQPHMQSAPGTQQQPHMQSAPGTQQQPYMQTGPGMQQPHMQSAPGTQQPYMQTGPQLPQQQPHMQSSPGMQQPHMQSAPGTQQQPYMQTGPQLPQQQPHMRSSPGMQQPHMQSAPGTQQQPYMQTGPQLPQQQGHMQSSPGMQQPQMQSAPGMQQPHMQSSPQVVPPPKSGSKRLLVFVIIGVLAGVIAGVVLLAS